MVGVEYLPTIAAHHYVGCLNIESVIQHFCSSSLHRSITTTTTTARRYSSSALVLVVLLQLLPITTTTATVVVTDTTAPAMIVNASTSKYQPRSASWLRMSGDRDDSDAAASIRVWQLYNHCSHGFIQLYYRILNARGKASTPCLIDFKVLIDPVGRIQLVHALNGRFLCFNRRKRVTVKLDGNSRRCEFIEHQTPSGYTQLESAAVQGLYLGFNRHGRFQDPDKFVDRQRCFHFTKITKYVPSGRLATCANGTAIRRFDAITTSTVVVDREQVEMTVPPVNAELMSYKMMRESLLAAIRPRQ